MKVPAIYVIETTMRGPPISELNFAPLARAFLLILCAKGWHLGKWSKSPEIEGDEI